MENNKVYQVINYRPDIDGLRAIAVLSVILYHAFPKLCSGGFIGVDIFFVISGYLISSILFKNFENNNFCIRTFYARRIKRIFPALCVVLIFTLIFGWMILTDQEYLLLAKHIQASALFISNFVFANEAGYFDISAHFKPVLHLWSLSIEEQFYIIWPLLLYFTIKKNVNVALLVISILIFSFLISLKTYNTVEVFYYPWYRFWELMSGGLLAYFSIKKPPISDKLLINLLSLAGTALLLFSILFLAQIDLTFYYKYEKFSPFAGFFLNQGNLYALLPVMGALMIIMASQYAFFNKVILSHPLLVSIGLISYPLYLWHWSLISFSFIMVGQKPNNTILFIIICISIILATLTYYVIEKPIKASKDLKKIPIFLLIILATIVVFAHCVSNHKGYPNRQANQFEKVSFLPQNDPEFTNLKINCISPQTSVSNKYFTDPFCSSNTTQPQFLVIGNSHVLSFAYAAMLSPQWKMAIASISGKETFLEPASERIILYYQSIHDLLKNYPSIEYIVIIGYLEDTPAYIKGTIELIKTLLSQGKKVIFALDFPTLDYEPTQCLNRTFNISTKEDCIINKEKWLHKQQSYHAAIEKIKQQVPELMIYDPTSVFCDQTYCYAKKNNIILYGDQSHLNYDGSKILVDQFYQWFNLNTDTSH